MKELEDVSLHNNESDAMVERSVAADAHRLVAMATTMGKCSQTSCYGNNNG